MMPVWKTGDWKYVAILLGGLGLPLLILTVIARSWLFCDKLVLETESGRYVEIVLSRADVLVISTSEWRAEADLAHSVQPTKDLGGEEESIVAIFSYYRSMGGWRPHTPQSVLPQQKIAFPGFSYIRILKRIWLIKCSLWWPQLICIAGNVVPIRRFWIRRQRTRMGYCVNCGFDLRETPAKCPECGTVPGWRQIRGTPGS